MRDVVVRHYSWGYGIGVISEYDVAISTAGTQWRVGVEAVYPRWGGGVSVSGGVYYGGMWL